MDKAIIGYKDTLELLKEGCLIHYSGGLNPSAFISIHERFSAGKFVTVRLDALAKLRKEGLITDYDNVGQHTIFLKEYNCMKGQLKEKCTNA